MLDNTTIAKLATEGVFFVKHGDRHCEDYWIVPGDHIIMQNFAKLGDRFVWQLEERKEMESVKSKYHMIAPDLFEMLYRGL